MVTSFANIVRCIAAPPPVPPPVLPPPVPPPVLPPPVPPPEEEPPKQLPWMHCCAMVQLVQTLPAMPQASVCVPAWHTPDASQQPVAQVDAEHAGFGQPINTTVDDTTATTRRRRMGGPFHGAGDEAKLLNERRGEVSTLRARSSCGWPGPSLRGAPAAGKPERYVGCSRTTCSSS